MQAGCLGSARHSCSDPRTVAATSTAANITAVDGNTTCITPTGEAAATGERATPSPFPMGRTAADTPSAPATPEVRIKTATLPATFATDAAMTTPEDAPSVERGEVSVAAPAGTDAAKAAEEAVIAEVVNGAVSGAKVDDAIGLYMEDPSNFSPVASRRNSTDSPVSCPLPLSAAAIGGPWAPYASIKVWHSPSLSPVDNQTKSPEDLPGAPPEEASAKPPRGSPAKSFEETCLGLPSDIPRNSSEKCSLEAEAACRLHPNTPSKEPQKEAPGDSSEKAVTEGCESSGLGDSVGAVTNAFLEWCSWGDSSKFRGVPGGRSDGWGARKQIFEGLVERCQRQQLELQGQLQQQLRKQQQQSKREAEQGEKPQQQQRRASELPRRQVTQQQDVPLLQPIDATGNKQQQQQQGEKQPPKKVHEEKQPHVQQGEDQQRQRRRSYQQFSRRIRCMPSLVEAFLILGPSTARPVLDCCVGDYCEQQKQKLSSCCCDANTFQQSRDVACTAAAAAVPAAGEKSEASTSQEPLPDKQHQQQEELSPAENTNEGTQLSSSGRSSSYGSIDDLLQPRVWWCCTGKNVPCLFPKGIVPPRSNSCGSRTSIDSNKSRSNSSRCCSSSVCSSSRVHSCGSSRVHSLCSVSQGCAWAPSAAAANYGSNSNASLTQQAIGSSSTYGKSSSSSRSRSYCIRSCCRKQVDSCSRSASRGSSNHKGKVYAAHIDAVNAEGESKVSCSHLRTKTMQRRSCRCNSCFSGCSKRSISDTHLFCSKELTRRRSTSWPEAGSETLTATRGADAGDVTTSETKPAASPTANVKTATGAADAPAAAAAAEENPEAERRSKQHSSAIVCCRVRSVDSCNNSNNSNWGSSSSYKGTSRSMQGCWSCGYIPSFDVAVTREGKPKIVIVREVEAERAEAPRESPKAESAEESATAWAGACTPEEGGSDASWLPPEVPPAAELFCFPKGAAHVLPLSSGCLCTLLKPQQQRLVAAAPLCRSPWHSYYPDALQDLLSSPVQAAPTAAALASETTLAVSQTEVPQTAATAPSATTTTAGTAPACNPRCMCDWGGCPCASLLRVHSPTSSVFVLTDFQGRRLYGHCLRFFELVAMEMPNNNSCSPVNGGSKCTPAAHAEAPDETARKPEGEAQREVEKVEGEESAAGTRITDARPADAVADSCCSKPPLLYVERAFCILSELPFFGAFHEWLWCTYTSYAALCQTTACASGGRIVLQKQQYVQQQLLLASPLLYLQQQAERLVAETPAPVAAHIWQVLPLQQFHNLYSDNSSCTNAFTRRNGNSKLRKNDGCSCNKLKISVSLSSARALHFALPSPGSLPLLQLPLVDLLKCFPLELLLLILLLLLCEKQIVMLSASVNRLSLLPCALTALMYPLRYSQVFVPLLPAPLVHFVSMPLPFCVGMLTPQQERQEATVELLQPPGKSTSSSSNYRRRGGAPRGRPAPPAVYVCTLPDFSAAATSAATATAGTNSTSSNYNGNCTNTVSGNMLYAINMFAQSLDSFPLGVYLVDLDNCSVSLSHVAFATAAEDSQQRELLGPSATVAAAATAAEAAATAAAPGAAPWGLPPLPIAMLGQLISSLVPLLCGDLVAAAAAAAAAAAIVDENLTSQQRKMLQRHQQKQHKKRRQQQQPQIPAFLPSNWLLLRESIAAHTAQKAAAYSARRASSGSGNVNGASSLRASATAMHQLQGATKGDPLQLLRTSSTNQQQQRLLLSPYGRGLSSTSFGAAGTAGIAGTAGAGSCRNSNSNASQRGGPSRTHSGALLSVFRFLNLLPPGKTEQQQLQQQHGLQVQLQHLPQPAKLQLQQQQQHRRDNWLWRLWGQRPSAAGAEITDAAAAAAAAASAATVATGRGGPGQPALLRYSSVPAGAKAAAAAADVTTWMRSKESKQRQNAWQEKLQEVQQEHPKQLQLEQLERLKQMEPHTLKQEQPKQPQEELHHKLKHEEQQQKQQEQDYFQKSDNFVPITATGVSPTTKLAASSEAESAEAIVSQGHQHRPLLERQSLSLLEQKQRPAIPSNRGRRGVSLLWQRQCRSSSEVFERSKAWGTGTRPSAAPARGVTAPSTAAAALSAASDRDELWGPGTAISSAPATFIAAAGVYDGAAAVASAATESSSNLLPVWREFSGVSFESSEEGDTLTLSAVNTGTQDVRATTPVAAAPSSGNGGCISKAQHSPSSQAEAATEKEETDMAAAANALRIAALKQASTVCALPQIHPLDSAENPLGFFGDWSSSLAIDTCCQQRQEEQQRVQQKQADAAADAAVREAFLRFFVELLRGCNTFTGCRREGLTVGARGGPFKGKEASAHASRSRGHGLPKEADPLVQEICSTQAFASFLQLQDEARAAELPELPPGVLLQRHAEAPYGASPGTLCESGKDPLGALRAQSPRSVRAEKDAAAAAASYCKPFWACDPDGTARWKNSNRSPVSSANLATAATAKTRTEGATQPEPTASHSVSHYPWGSCVPCGVKYTVPVRPYSAAPAAVSSSSSSTMKSRDHLLDEGMTVLLRPRWPLSWPSASLRAAKKCMSSRQSKRSWSSSSSNRIGTSSNNSGTESGR